MQPLLRIWIPVVCGGTLFLAATATTASVLETHALVDAITLYGGLLDLPGERVRNVSNGSLDTGALSGTEAGAYLAEGTARAIVRTNLDHLLGVTSSAYDNKAGLFDGQGYGQGLAAYRDIAFVDSLSPPATIRLSFQIEGTLQGPDILLDPFAQFHRMLSELDVATSTDPVNFFASHASHVGTNSDHGNFAAWTLAAYILIDQFDNGSPYQLVGPWDSTLATDTAEIPFFGITTFVGNFHLDVPFDVSLGGYGWGIAVSAFSDARGGNSAVNSLNSLSLQSVTLLDGSPISVTFDSGLQFVPEPSSFFLILTGIFGLVTARRRAAL